MKFSTFLKDNRKSNSLTQSQLIDALSYNSVLLDDMTLLTYSRWERGVCIPSTLRMVTVSIFFNCSTLAFIKDIEFQQISKQIEAFSEYRHYHQQLGHTYYRAASYAKDKLNFQEYNELNVLKDKAEYLKVVRSNRRRYDMSGAGVNDDQLFEIGLLWQQSGAMTTLISRADDGSIDAHCSISKYKIEDKRALFQSIDENHGSIAPLTFPSKECRSFLFIHFFMVRDEPWWGYCFKKILTILLTSPKVEGVYITLISPESVKEHVKLGFEVVSIKKVVSRTLTGGRDSLTTASNYLLRINSKVLLSHHGIMNFIKEEM